MQDQLNDMLKTFGSYSLAYSTLEPVKVKPFFYSSSMLMTSEQVVVMHKTEEILEVFKALMESLKLKNYKESKIIDELKATQLSNNQGLVGGVAKRFDKENQEIEHFGFTYTLRKVEDKWKIVGGVIHDPETLSK